mgnify:CR=1 FL=1
MSRIKNLARPFFHTSRRVLAKLWLQSHKKTQVIGVTGSFGKTNTVAAINAVLAEKYKTLTTDINLDTIYNIPITILKLTNQEKLLLEYSASEIRYSSMEGFLIGETFFRANSSRIFNSLIVWRV